MAFQGTLVWLYSLAVLSFSVAQDDSSSPNDCLKTDLVEELSAKLKLAVQCSDAWSPEQTATILQSLTNLTDTLQKQQLKDCQNAEPKNCIEAQVPENGGLACVTVDNRRLCKPMCSHGYDFNFLRRSRLFEECSEQTSYKWQTQYVGGNKLAECNEAKVQVSGAKTAYFPKDQSCLTTKSNRTLQRRLLEDLTTELKNLGIQGEPQNPCLVCG
ncbi:uncharacterized protein si:ch1073-126c3.2 [Etheostoma spectabile]|uniref:uncharacterized protein si:ch1073-126c3.2 n=1 Tax=Etheostoma spectabile TaxID=54343 RepID=UPI0013AED8FD|nr:uncharacterized protein LOC116705767 [Etheostoma spectabile]